MEVIDLYQIHWPTGVRRKWRRLGNAGELKSEGKVRWIGVSNFDVEQLQRAQPSHR